MTPISELLSIHLIAGLEAAKVDREEITLSFRDIDSFVSETLLKVDLPFSVFMRVDGPAGEHWFIVQRQNLRVIVENVFGQRGYFWIASPKDRLRFEIDYFTDDVGKVRCALFAPATLIQTLAK